MFFSTIEDEATRSGLRITNIFSSTFKNIVAIFQQKQGIKFDSVFSESLQNDRTALLNYRSAINSGVSDTEAFKMTMTNASKEAQTFVQTLAQSGQSVNIKAISDFTKHQKMANVTLQAQDTSLGNVRAMLNEYNSGMQSAGNVCANTGLTQAQFTASVNQSNSSLGQYLIGLEGGKASMAGYVGTLISAKVATIGLRIVTTALNAVIGMGIGLILSLIASGISQLIEMAKENLKPIADKLKDVNSELKNTQKEINDIASSYKKLDEQSKRVIPRFVELAKGVNTFGENVSLTDEEYAEFLELNNEIAEMFPEINMGMDSNGKAILGLSYSADTLANSLRELVKAQKEQKNQELASKLPDLLKKSKEKRELLSKEIEEEKKELEDYEKWYENFSSGEYTTERRSGTDHRYEFGRDVGEWDEEKFLNALGVKWHKEEVDDGSMYPYKKYKYIIDSSISEFKTAYNNYIAGCKNVIQSKEKEIKETWQSISQSLQAWLSTNSTFESFDENLQKVAREMLKNIDWSQLGIETDAEIERYIEDNVLRPLQEASFKVKDGFSDLFNITPDQFNSFSEYTAAIQKKIKEIADIDPNDAWTYDKIYKDFGFEKIINDYQATADEIKKLIPGVTDEMVNSLAPGELTDALEVIKTNGIKTWDELMTYINARKITGVFDEKSKEQLKEEIDKINNSLSKLKDTYDSITGIISDYNENGYYSTDDLQKLLELEPEYLNLLIDENGQINLNSQAYREYIAAKAKILVLDQIRSLYNNILNMSAEEAQAYANVQAYQAQAASLGDLITATTQYYLILARSKDKQNNTTAYTDALSRSFGTVANYAAVYDSWLNSLSSSNNEFTKKTKESKSALDSQKEALESQKKALEDEKEALDKTKSSLEDYKNSLENAQNNIKALIDLVTDYIKQMKENEKDAINEQIDALDKQKDALDDQKDAYSDLISKKKEEIELLYEEKKAQDELSEKQKSAAKDALALAIAQLDDSSAGKKSQKQAADNYAESSKDLKDYLDEQEKDKRISALEEEETRYSEMIEQRKAAIDAQVEHLESKIDEIDAYLDNSRKLYEDACRMIDNDNGTLYSNLWNYTYTYTTKTRAEFDYLWSSAQAAIQRYKGDNDTLISTMEFLQGKIYDTDRQINGLNTQIDNCETQIGYLDDAISSTSDAISATSDSIDSVSGSLDGLGNSISDYINKLNQLTGINVGGNNIGGNNNSDTTPKYLGHGYDAASGNYYYKVKFRGRDYYGYVGDSSDTTAVRERAYNAIMKEVYKYNSFNDVNPLLFKNAIVNHHAKGTRHSAGGVSVTQEEGLEAIFGKLSQGQYTMMPQGSQVFNAGMTDNLWKFSSNPQKFISDVIGKMSSFLSSSYGNFADSARGVTNKVTKYGGDVTLSSAPVYHIYGNVDKNTLSTMDKQERQRYELFKKQFMLEMLREKNNL